MYKRFILSLALLMAIPCILTAQQMPTKMAVIDVDRVVLESSAGKEAFQNLQEMGRKKAEEAKKYETDLSNLEKMMSDQKYVLSEEKLAELRKQYEDKNISYKRFKDDTQREMENARSEELKKLEKKIMPIIEEVGREGNYSLIFNKFNSGLVYASEAVDITEDVLRRFNTQINIPPPAK
ncbi:MAG TPA: OmpH family outer membrane protein [Thermoanaerobaculia bacterium]|nr:OmpH family outer membrane protein [Thermoanaerobaculia bacterium]HUM29718.1 OmpH family outer membrane protein [Thermoanaerobaculia bacterium]HXK67018.1 OmpH family outer membrane protein [Thermoanaerobaculia bacterium]